MTMTYEDTTDLIDYIRQRQASCTCTPESDIRECPNYEPGDEVLMEDDDDE